MGVRVETGYQQGQVIGPYYDAMLAKIIACGGHARNGNWTPSGGFASF